MKPRIFACFFSLLLIALVAACAPVPVPPASPTASAPDATQTAFIPTSTPPAITATLATESSPPVEISPTPTASQTSSQQFLAYVQDGQLLVSDVTGGVLGGTTQYTMTGESDQVSDIAWSPSGEFVAFTSSAKGDPHVFYIFALGESSPTDLGPGSAPTWSPDSQSIAYIGGTYPDNNIWVTTIENPVPRQLTSETNYAWGNPVFTPDGQSLILAGTDRNNMGAQGNTTFTLESLALDGSGTRTPLPGATPFEGGRLPYDLKFSPDGTKLAFSTSFHLSACASPGAYYVSNADGGNRQELVSPYLKPTIDSAKEHYHVGLSYDWNASSNALVALGNVVDCDISSPTNGQVLAGPQLSVIGLDGSEGLIIPGFFYGISVDRTGTMIAAAHFQNGFQDLNPVVEIYSAQNGQLMLSLGPGSDPNFQP
ncbi:MAG: TolB family protein [Byssovorax cruenta]